MNHAPGAGLIAQPVEQQSSALPLCHRCSPLLKELVRLVCRKEIRGNDCVNRKLIKIYFYLISPVSLLPAISHSPSSVYDVLGILGTGIPLPLVISHYSCGPSVGLGGGIGSNEIIELLIYHPCEALLIDLNWGGRSLPSAHHLRN